MTTVYSSWQYTQGGVQGWRTKNNIWMEVLNNDWVRFHFDVYMEYNWNVGWTNGSGNQIYIQVAESNGSNINSATYNIGRVGTQSWNGQPSGSQWTGYYRDVPRPTYDKTVACRTWMHVGARVPGSQYSSWAWFTMPGKAIDPNPPKATFTPSDRVVYTGQPLQLDAKAGSDGTSNFQRLSVEFLNSDLSGKTSVASGTVGKREEKFTVYPSQFKPKGDMVVRLVTTFKQGSTTSWTWTDYKVTVKEGGLVHFYDDTGKEHKGLVYYYDNEGKRHNTMVSYYDENSKNHICN